MFSLSKKARAPLALACVVTAALVTGTAAAPAFAADITSGVTAAHRWDSRNQAVEGVVVALPTFAADTTDPTRSVVQVTLLTQGRQSVISTEPVATATATALAATLTPGALIAYTPHPKNKTVAATASDPARTFVVVYAAPFSGSGERRNFTFDTMKYGPELPGEPGNPGAMAAAGWIYAKDLKRGTITVSDGRILDRDMAGRPYTPAIKRYEETYQLAKDVAVYNVNTDNYSASTVSTLGAVPVTADYKYSTTNRQQVYVVFDKNYRDARKAKVVALYYFTPQSVTTGKPVWDIGNNSSMLNAMGTVPASESALYAGVRYNDIPYQAVNYEQSTEPFEITKDSVYSVGDNEVAIYLFKTGKRLILLDTGYATAGYQYWRNIEAVGVDPRKITDVMLTHAHGDHNGTTMELINMVRAAGGDVTLWGGDEEVNGIKTDAQGNVWNKPPTLGTNAVGNFVRANTSVYYKSGRTYDLGSIDVTPVFTPGHTNGIYSFYFDVPDPKNVKKTVRLAYQGGFGWNPLKQATNANGWQRLVMQFELAYLQQTTKTPYVLPQHTDMSPIVEAFQAVKAWNRDPANRNRQRTVWDALSTTTGGVNEFENMLEKRYQSFVNPLTDSTGAGKTITEFGPHKPGRENGVTDAEITLVDGGKIIRGFDKYWLVNKNFPLLKDGVYFEKESYPHDPGAYYVQVYADVKDDATYPGLLPEGYQQTVKGTAFTYAGGPVESIYPDAGTPEVLRTARLGSLAEAKAVLATLRKGATYTVDLTSASEIIVPATVTETFTRR